MRGLRDDISVLHVDDNDDVAQVTAEHIERVDDRVEVTIESSGSNALAALDDRAIDCVVSDYDMPAMDGIELLERVRERYGDLPFVLYTAKGSEEIASEAISSGVTDYLQKQIGEENYQLLVNRVVEAVGRRRAETSYREIFENLPDGLVVHDPETGEFLDMNERYAELYGYESREAFLDAGFGAIIPDHPDFTMERAQEYIEAAREEGPQNFEWIGERSDGVPKWFNVHLAEMTIRGEDRIVASVRDIEEEKRREQELHATKETLEAVIEASPEAIMAVDEDGRLTMWNPAAEEMFGWSEEEVLGEPNPTVPDEKREEYEAHRERAFDGEASTGIETQRLRKDGERVDVSLSTAAIRGADGGIEGGMAVIEDITDRKDRERRLARYKRIVENLPVGVYRTDAAGRIVDGNQAALDIMEADSFDEMRGRNVLGLYATEEGRERITEALQTDGVVEAAEVRAETLEGTTKWVEVTTAEVEEDGEVYYDGILTDVTERREWERELERTRELLQQTQAIADVGGWTFDLTGDPPYVPRWTEGMRNILEYPADEDPPPLEDLIDLYQGEDRGRRDAIVNEALERREGWEVEARIETFGGDTKWVRSVAEPSWEGDELVRVLGSFQDITRQKERERAVERRNERLQEFAEVLSHDLRDPLMVAQGRLAMALEDRDEDVHLEAVDDAHGRMEAIIENLLRMAREGDDAVDPSPVDPGLIAKRAWQHVATGEARLDVDVTDDVLADPDHLQRLFANVFRNAVEHGGGDVAVTVDQRDDRLVVRDDGEGFPDASVDELTEPGRSMADDGTGYGLAIVERIAEAHDWELAVGESPSGGAEVAIEDVTSP